MILLSLAESSMIPGERWLKSFSYDQREAVLSCYHEAGDIDDLIDWARYPEQNNNQ